MSIKLNDKNIYIKFIHVFYCLGGSKGVDLSR